MTTALAWVGWPLLVVLGIAATVFALLWHRARARENALLETQTPPLLEDDAVRVLSILKAAAVLIDSDGDLVSASPPAYAFGLVRADELVQPAVRDLVAKVRAGAEIVEEELELERGIPGASDVMLLVRVATIGKGRILVLAEDRTEAHRLEAIRRDFVVNVSHELKSPVGALSLLAETVADAADDPEAVRKFAGQMHTEANRLSVLVQEIIELSRIQSASVMADVKVVNLSDVVSEAVARVQTAAVAKNIAIRQAGGEDLLVYGDEPLLTTAVRNLLDNAINYSPANTRVGIGISQNNGMVDIAVVDQGIGIDKEDHARIFERFYRTDPARSRVTGGTGLGLSIVKHIARDHGGDITVWSAPRAGSTFTLRIPAADSQHSATAGSAAPVAAAAAAALSGSAVLAGTTTASATNQDGHRP